MSTLISFCMIVKNEEKVLRRCLDSVKDLVDEIIIVDTGSEDTTKEIASEYTDNIIDFEWIDDFSAARNAGRGLATGKWIMWLDADEFLQEEDHQALKDYLRAVSSDQPYGLVLPIYNYTGVEKDGRFIESSAVRLFANHPDIGFVNRIHEQVKYSKGPLPLYNYHFVIYHTGYLAAVREEKDKLNRNKVIFEKIQSEKKLDKYESFTFANELMIQGNNKKAFQYYEKAYKKADKT